MGLKVHRLIYCSRIAVPESSLDATVTSIIESSVRNNRKAEVTGLLLAHRGYFLQVLEGPMEAVLTTYSRICNDPRHTDATVLSAGPAPEREFGHWNMCARRVTPADDAILQTLAQRDTYQPEKLTAAQALRLLTTVRRVQDRTQDESVVVV